MIGVSRCSRCMATKPLSAFYLRGASFGPTADQPRSLCKACCSEASRERQKRNPRKPRKYTPVKVSGLICSHCGEAFSGNKSTAHRMKSGLPGYCSRACITEKQRLGAYLRLGSGNKRCSSCACTKPLIAFPRCWTRPDGVGGWCKDCSNRKHRERETSTARERKLARSALYRESLTDFYVVSCLHLPVGIRTADVPRSLIAAKRASLVLVRHLEGVDRT